MNTPVSSDPFAVLGVPNQASEAEIRARYLELVKQFPPDREPDRFREIQAAFEAAKDPLVIARRLITPPDHQESPPDWESAIAAARENPPKLSPAFLLSLGNRDSQSSAPSQGQAPMEKEPD